MTRKRTVSANFAAHPPLLKAVALMWRTAPPRMPLEPAAELCRLRAAEPIIEEAI
jgi:hypothetical protein